MANLQKKLDAEKEKNLQLSNRTVSGQITNLVPVFHSLPFCPVESVKNLVQKELKDIEKERKMRSVQRGTQARYRDTILDKDGKNK